MTRGGPRPGSGPAPSVDALKRVRDGKEWTRLPKQGLQEDQVPTWPEHMRTEPPTWPEVAKTASEMAERDRLRLRWTSEREREHAYWTRLWTLQPQAHVWRADGTEDVVALFVRTMTEASEPGATTAVRTLAKQLSSDLLLNTAALHSARYVIDREMEGEPAFPDLGAVAATGTTGPAAPRRSIRDGLTIVPPPDDDGSDS